VAAAVVSAAQVVAPLFARMLAVARYCNTPSDRLVPCRSGQPGVVAQPQRLLELGFTARRAVGPHSWYSWNLEAPHRCPQASAGGPTRAPVRVGSRLVFDVLIPPDCRGTVHVEALYVTHALTADQERLTLVGRRTLRLY
jgi:hypothetical protein